MHSFGEILILAMSKVKSEVEKSQTPFQKVRAIHPKLFANRQKTTDSDHVNSQDCRRRALVSTLGLSLGNAHTHPHTQQHCQRERSNTHRHVFLDMIWVVSAKKQLVDKSKVVFLSSSDAHICPSSLTRTSGGGRPLSTQPRRGAAVRSAALRGRASEKLSPRRVAETTKRGPRRVVVDSARRRSPKQVFEGRSRP